MLKIITYIYVILKQGEVFLKFLWLKCSWTYWGLKCSNDRSWTSWGIICTEDWSAHELTEDWHVHEVTEVTEVLMNLLRTVFMNFSSHITFHICTVHEPIYFIYHNNFLIHLVKWSILVTVLETEFMNYLWIDNKLFMKPAAHHFSGSLI